MKDTPARNAEESDDGSGAGSVWTKPPPELAYQYLYCMSKPVKPALPHGLLAGVQHYRNTEGAENPNWCSLGDAETLGTSTVVTLDSNLMKHSAGALVLPTLAINSVKLVPLYFARSMLLFLILLSFQKRRKSALTIGTYTLTYLFIFTPQQEG
ncbi:hypothetical protein llap_6603 [Limosa lapponica baueri]|uniref:Uncharacterized protein n=1 Tax=Limosa lapponica baueri TaxID=1758121 RepID=A0A2I0UAL1_LIMLA|nr:hypothetical protein llap_6603 [Limosa lapponica baueri]